ncbi:RagB/SusD family nutrient uptake outer membrane protein [Deminuibacter soli]|uniref:RagB/SusD family nutrient uptake outer membrane protein n=1 Tax=Deminuibacter soli TaxID=2291815 RepID=A0A3E1NIN3_9BACT|nr:RagB/SusD family nutrient uptake outer membrane protein [Deminuibacter soli]RFM27787.1 RagB/SusD family nutrient uptake outer membrane protein [Deminuibacter soli]
MKKQLYNITGLLVLLLVFGCKKSFLEMDPQSTLTAGTFFKTASDIKQAVNGCYIPLRDMGRIDYWLFGEMRSDNTGFQFNKENRGLETQREFVDEFLTGATAESVLDLWQRSYSGISNCNDVLGSIGGITMPDSAKNQYTGEVSFIRAFHYFTLVRQFGDVPLRLKSVNSPAESRSEGRAKTDMVYATIIADLKEASAKLPVKYGSTDAGRATRGAAETMLAEVYMTRKQFDSAATVLKDVITLGYSLQADYKSIFDPANKNNSESVFELQYSGILPELASSFMYTFAPYTSGSVVTGDVNTGMGVDNGWNIPTQDMLDTYEAGDKRKDASLATGFTDATGFVNIPYVKKYNWGFVAPGRTNVNFIVYRYADVLLMLAECLNETGQGAQALHYLNDVFGGASIRGRAALAPITVTDQTQLREAIAHERRVELAFENHRWYDLVRTGKAVDVMNAHGVQEKQLKSFIPAAAFQVTANKLLLPVPQREVSIDNLQQNPL